ncbi:MAG: 4-(cytidine 5'-diphospho)-2-C-methyl-D-erythritol kinase [bacterium]
MTCGYRGPGVRVRVPAKINLHLAVGPRRPDGYHELLTVFHAVSLFDTVTAVAAPALTLEVTGADAAVVPDGPQNLAWRAAEVLAEHHGRRPGVRLLVDKAIPMMAGLAGGSADAAAALVACDAVWQLHTPRPELVALAATLGSDVPFALTGGTAIGTGRGETLTPLMGSHLPLWWVLAIAAEGLSTPAVYAQFDRWVAPVSEADPLAAPTGLLRAIGTGDAKAVARELRNDLQAPSLALRRGLADTLAAGLDAGALGGLVSGSGPTCAFLTEDAASAGQVAERLGRAGVCRTTRVVTGPVTGASLC